MWELLVNFGIWGNHGKLRNLWEPVGHTGGNQSGRRQSAAFKKLSKNPLKPRLVRELVRERWIKYSFGVLPREQASQGTEKVIKRRGFQRLALSFERDSSR